jgi:hypothetical protein
MYVDDNSTIALEFNHYKRYIRNFYDYINQQKMSFPMNYTKLIQSRNIDIANNVKK